MGLESFECFDPEYEDFRTYIERLEQLFIVNGTKPEIKAAVLITVIGRKAYSILKNLCVPENPKEKTYDELVSLLSNHYAPVRITIAERFKFYKRTQRSGESISDFLIDLKRLASTCNFGAFLNDALRDVFVCGLYNENIQRKLLSEENLTFEQACKVATAMDLASKETNKFHSTGNHGVPTVEVVRQQKPANSNANRKKNFSKKSKDLNSRPVNQFPERCKRCGNMDHHENECPARNWKCFTCHRRGHASKMCRSKVKLVDLRSSTHKEHTQGPSVQSQEQTKLGTTTQIQVSEATPTSSDLEDFAAIFGLGNVNMLQSVREPMIVDIPMENTTLRMEIDTGAAVSLIPAELYLQKFPQIPLMPSKTKLRSVVGEPLNILGEVTVSVTTQNTGSHLLPLFVVEGISTPLLGRSWLEILAPNWKRQLTAHLPTGSEINSQILEPEKINSGNTNDSYVQELRNNFANVFDMKTEEKIIGFQAQIHIRDHVKPMFLKAYPVPYALLGKVEEELENLQDKGIIVPITQSEWASPIVIVPKANSTNIRMCVDFKRSVNRVITTEHYPLPKIDDILATLARGKIFAVLDLTNAYQQLEVSAESRELLTINTHKGLYQFTRLPFGISCAPAIFQRVMDNILKGIPHACCYLDDVLITGSNETDLKDRVAVVMERLARFNVKVNLNKCRFLVTSVDYLGHQISAEGIRPSSKNSDAILQAPSPSNITQLRSYLGMINFYAKFIPNLSIEMKSLYNLLKAKVPWVWSEECELAFRRSKTLIRDHNLLVHYDPEKPLFLMCDASAYGLGAVLLHREGKQDRPIVFASTTLTKPEQNYAQIEREALALIFGVKRLHKYLWGRKFTLITDHRPLQFLFGVNKGIPTQSAARIQRWALILSSYEYEIQYRKGKELVLADALSRLPLPIERTSIVCSFAFCNELPVTATNVATATELDPSLSQVMEYTLRGWPDRLPDVTLKPYWSRRNEISTEQGVLLWGNRVIIPRELRSQVLQALHANHPGVVRMKMQARSYFWWPGVDCEIEGESASCTTCQRNQDLPPKAKGSWPSASKPWERVHIDLACIQGVQLLTLVDSYSKWIEAYVMKSTTSEGVIAKLRRSFACFGLPSTLVADNGAQFSSSEFKDFCSSNAINLIHTPIYHPSSNGQVERAVRTVKSSLRKRFFDHPGESPELSLDQVIFTYRNTPCTTTGQSPASMMLSYTPRILLEALRPTAPVDSSSSVGKRHRYEYTVGQKILVRSVRDKTVLWWPGRVIEVRSPLTYLVSSTGKTRFVHRDHLRPQGKP